MTPRAPRLPRLHKAPSLPPAFGHLLDSPEGRAAVGAGLWVQGLARLQAARRAKARGQHGRAVALSRLGLELVSEGVALAREA